MTETVVPSTPRIFADRAVEAELGDRDAVDGHDRLARHDPGNRRAAVGDHHLDQEAVLGADELHPDPDELGPRLLAGLQLDERDRQRAERGTVARGHAGFDLRVKAARPDRDRDRPRREPGELERPVGTRDGPGVRGLRARATAARLAHDPRVRDRSGAIGRQDLALDRRALGDLHDEVAIAGLRDDERARRPAARRGLQIVLAVVDRDLELAGRVRDRACDHDLAGDAALAEHEQGVRADRIAGGVHHRARERLAVDERDRDVPRAAEDRGRVRGRKPVGLGGEHVRSGRRDPRA